MSGGLSKKESPLRDEWEFDSFFKEKHRLFCAFPEMRCLNANSLGIIYFSTTYWIILFLSIYH